MEFVSTLEAQARAALKSGDFVTASGAAKALVLEDQRNPEGFYLLALVAEQTGQTDQALTLISAAVERGPEAGHLACMARLFSLLRRDGEAADAVKRALALAPENAHTLDTIGCVLARLGDHEGSIAPFLAAVAAAPANLDFRYNLATACGFTARIDEARAQYETILRRDPGNARAHYALAILSRQSVKTNHLPRLKTALAQARDPADRLRIRYALAKELEDCGNSDSFAYLAAANAEHKRTLGYDFAQDAAIFDAIEALFTHGKPALHAGEVAEDGAGAGASQEAPIFVVGMPRTGTTLVDRILSSHPDVGSAGELQAMPLAVKRLAQSPSRNIIDPATILASGDLDPASIGAAYLAQAAHHRTAGSPRFTDKLPANFLYVGHIARALPNARIVCLRRNPMDTVWSNFKNLFASQSAYYSYSYDLLDTARYYARFVRLMDAWEALFPGRVLHLSYEQLVADQEGQTRKLLEHCGLVWDEACLNFYTNSAAVATPSAAQVRRPLNADAVGRWRAHEDALEPVRAWFEAEAIPLD